jgi:hypothetical protein
MSETKAKSLFAKYGFPAILAVILLVLLPPILSPYMGLFGTYTTYVVSFVVLIVALWIGDRVKPAIEKA